MTGALLLLLLPLSVAMCYILPQCAKATAGKPVDAAAAACIAAPAACVATNASAAAAAFDLLLLHCCLCRGH